MKKCGKCNGCGCPACLGTGSGFAKGLVGYWGTRNVQSGLTPEEVPDLPVTQQREVKDFLRQHIGNFELYHTKKQPTDHEKKFLIEPCSNLVPADQPVCQRVRWNGELVQIRIAYTHALEEPLIAFTGRGLNVLMGIHSERLFMVEFKPNGFSAKAIQGHVKVINNFMDSIMGWSPGSNRKYALGNFVELSKWLEGLGV